MNPVNLVSVCRTVLFILFLFPVQYAKNRLVYFSQRLRASMKGAGTDDSALIRLVISRSEVRIHVDSIINEKKINT